MLLQAKKIRHVTFICEVKPDAKEVYLVGDFNQWRTREQRMLKAEDGSFRTRVELAPGRYRYKFVVDGTWYDDPDAPHQESDSCGMPHSVFTVP